MKISKEIRRFYFSIFVMAFFLGACGEASNAQQENNAKTVKVELKSEDQEQAEPENKNDIAQDKKTYQFLDLVKFDYPVYFPLYKHPMEHRMRSRFLNKNSDGSIGGLMYVEISSKEVRKQQTVVKELSEFLDYYSQDEFRFKTVQQIEFEKEYALPASISDFKIEAYAIDGSSEYGHIRNFKNHEFWIAVLEEGRFFYITLMITPSREIKPHIWEQNAAAFKIVLESIGPVKRSDQTIK